MTESADRFREHSIRDRKQLEEVFNGDIERLIVSKGIVIKDAPLNAKSKASLSDDGFSIFLKPGMSERKRKKALAKALGLMYYRERKDSMATDDSSTEKACVSDYSDGLLNGPASIRNLAILGVLGAIVLAGGTFVMMTVGALGLSAAMLWGAPMSCLAVGALGVSEAREHKRAKRRIESGGTSPRVKSKKQLNDEEESIIAEAEAAYRSTAKVLAASETEYALNAREALQDAMRKLQEYAKVSRETKAILDVKTSNKDVLAALEIYQEDRKDILAKMEGLTLSIQEMLIEALGVQKAERLQMEEPVDQLKSAKQELSYIGAGYKEIDSNG